MEVKERRDDSDVKGFHLDQGGGSANSENKHIGGWAAGEQRFSCEFGRVDLGLLKVTQVTIARRILLYGSCAQKEMWEWRKRCEEEEEGESPGSSE